MALLWTPSLPATAVTPSPPATQFRVDGLAWSAKGDTLLLLDKDRFCLCFIAPPTFTEGDSVDGGESTGANAQQSGE